jgi:hypothetical protein
VRFNIGAVSDAAGVTSDAATPVLVDSGGGGLLDIVEVISEESELFEDIIYTLKIQR